MIYCSNCGQKLDNDMKFCTACGTPVADTVKSTRGDITASQQSAVHNDEDAFPSIENTAEQGSNNNKIERFLGIDMTPENKRKAQTGWYIALVIIGIIIVWNMFGTGVSEKQIYQDAIDVLETDYAQEEGIDVEYPGQDLVDIDEEKSNVYVVTGNIYGDNNMGYPFSVKLVYKQKNITDYEWQVG